MTVQDADYHFIRPMMARYRLDIEDHEEFVREMAEELARASIHALQSAAARFKKTRRYKTFPSMAECLEMVAAVETAATTDRDEMESLEISEAAHGKAYVAKDSPNWPIMVERFKRMNGGRKPPCRYCQTRNSHGWWFYRDWIENLGDNWDERRVTVDQRGADDGPKDERVAQALEWWRLAAAKGKISWVEFAARLDELGLNWIATLIRERDAEHERTGVWPEFPRDGESASRET